MDNSTKEIEDRDQFAPHWTEVIKKHNELVQEWFIESDGAREARLEAAVDTASDLNEWISDETQRRIDADTARGFPVRRIG